MLKISQLTQFKKDLKLIHKRGYDLRLMKEVIDTLSLEQKLPIKYRNHRLVGNYKNSFECHIQPDWLLIYKITSNPPMLLLVRTGSHSDLFR